jgi:hypothetical protein
MAFVYDALLVIIAIAKNMHQVIHFPWMTPIAG